MQRIIPFFAIFCSLIAGTFASEFVSSLGKRDSEEVPARVSAPIGSELSSKVALGSPTVEQSGSLNN
jgi:hypothetical protein